MKISIGTIYNDLFELKEKYGEHFLLILCASLIFSFNWWGWPELKHNILTDEEFNKPKEG